MTDFMKNSLLFLLLFTNNVNAQVQPQKTATVYLNYPDYSVKMNVLNISKKLEAKGHLTYYWYSSNRIMETQGGYDGKVLDGSYTSFYLSNNLKEKGTFKNGLKNGEWTTWFENGKIHEITSWKRGLKNGVTKTFNNNGELIKETGFKYNQLNGCMVNYDHGKVIDKKIFKKGVEVLVPVKDSTNKKSAKKRKMLLLKKGRRKKQRWRKQKRIL